MVGGAPFLEGLEEVGVPFLVAPGAVVDFQSAKMEVVSLLEALVVDLVDLEA